MAEDDQGVTDAALKYMERSQPVHALLKQVLVQVSGCALAATMENRPDWSLEAAVDLAQDAAARALDGVCSLSAPAEADRHHYHLSAAARETWRAPDLIRRRLRDRSDEQAADRLSQCLHAATDHLRATAKLMPGHPMVDLSQACCAMHAREMIQLER